MMQKLNAAWVILALLVSDFFDKSLRSVSMVLSSQNIKPIPNLCEKTEL